MEILKNIIENQYIKTIFNMNELNKKIDNEKFFNKFNEYENIKDLNFNLFIKLLEYEYNNITFINYFNEYTENNIIYIFNQTGINEYDLICIKSELLETFYINIDLIEYENYYILYCYFQNNY